jgi:hypothetical protein
MDEILQEFVDSRGVNMRIDRAAGVIRGVKLLGFESRNGRKYLPEALSQAVGLYEGAKVNVNHPKGNPLAARDYQDRLGRIRNVAVRPAEGVFGDLFFNPKHALAEQLAWDAEHAPENVGFSHNVQARTSRQGDQTVVEAILKVQSIDLVADPATTRGLFEAAGGDFPSAGRLPVVSQCTLEELRQARPDLVTQIQESLQAELGELRRELDRCRAAEAARARRRSIDRLLAEFHLPDPEQADAAGKSIVSEVFLESLFSAPDEARLRQLIEERANMVRGVRDWQTAPRPAKPVSREQTLPDLASARAEAESFARAITI